MKHPFYLHILLVILPLVAVAGLMTSLIGYKNAGQSTAPVESQIDKGGVLGASSEDKKVSLRFQTNTNSVIVGQPFTVSIIGDTQGKAIVGYDLLLSFPKDTLKLVSTRAVLPEFTHFVFEKSEGVTITGTKSLSSSSTVLKGTSVEELTFMPLSSGNVTISIVPKWGSEQTKMVDDTLETNAPDAASLELAIQ